MEAVKEADTPAVEYLCPGCETPTRKLSGPLKSEPHPVTQDAEFCSYQCWRRHRAETGQDDWR